MEPLRGASSPGRAVKLRHSSMRRCRWTNRRIRGGQRKEITVLPRQGQCWSPAFGSFFPQPPTTSQSGRRTFRQAAGMRFRYSCLKKVFGLERWRPTGGGSFSNKKPGDSSKRFRTSFGGFLRGRGRNDFASAAEGRREDSERSPGGTMAGGACVACSTGASTSAGEVPPAQPGESLRMGLIIRRGLTRADVRGARTGNIGARPPSDSFGRGGGAWNRTRTVRSRKKPCFAFSEECKGGHRRVRDTRGDGQARHRGEGKECTPREQKNPAERGGHLVGRAVVASACPAEETPGISRGPPQDASTNAKNTTQGPFGFGCCVACRAIGDPARSLRRRTVSPRPTNFRPSGGARKPAKKRIPAAPPLRPFLFSKMRERNGESKNAAFLPGSLRDRGRPAFLAVFENRDGGWRFRCVSGSMDVPLHLAETLPEHEERADGVVCRVRWHVMGIRWTDLAGGLGARASPFQQRPSRWWEFGVAASVGPRQLRGGSWLAWRTTGGSCEKGFHARP